MTRISAFLLLAASLSLGSCQCSEKPDIGPVEEETSAIDARDDAINGTSGGPVRAADGAYFPENFEPGIRS